MKYRIKQTAENEFIPQAKTWLLGDWRSIDKFHLYLWYSEIIGAKWCTYSTYEEAKQVILDYKANQENKRKYPKYYKL